VFPPTGLARGLAGAAAQPFGHDLVAGLVVAAMLVPQAMAYAALAGLPAQAGLYASAASLLVYGLLGASRSLSVGPVAIDSLLTAQGLAGLAVLGTLAAQEHGAALALLAGAAYLAFWMLRLGRLAALLSAPVLLGFTHAAALVIAFSQVRHLARLAVEPGGRPLEVIGRTFGALGEAHLLTLALGLGTLLLLLAWRRAARRAFEALGAASSVAAALARAAPLVAVVLTGGLVASLALEGEGVRVVGDVPQGLPTPSWPAIPPEHWLALVPTALVVAAIGFLEAISIATTLGRLRREPVDPDAELFGLGLANAACGVVGGYPVTGGLSRSMVNHQAGALSGRASVVTSGLVVLALVALAPWFHPIPQAALAAVVVVAVAGLVDLPAFARMWRADRREGLVALGTFAAVLAIGVEVGMLVGLALEGAALLARRRKAGAAGHPAAGVGPGEGASRG
jgi:SulP family sulfate permease